MCSWDYLVTDQSILYHAIKTMKARATKMVSKLFEEEVNSCVGETPSTTNTQNEPNKKLNEGVEAVEQINDEKSKKQSITGQEREICYLNLCVEYLLIQ